jgi:hypothetical protein
MHRQVSAIITTLALVSTLSFGMDVKGNIGLETRAFGNDYTTSTTDQNYAMRSQIDLKDQIDWQEYHIRVFNRFDQTDLSRNLLLVEEAWVGISLDEWTFRAGSQLLNWGALEAFHPADVLNSRNFDSDIENAEKFGEPMISVSHLHEAGTVAIYYMPNFISPNFPNITNRLAVSSSTKLGNARFFNSNGHEGNSSADQYAIQFETSLDDTDISVHYVQHIDRSQPLFVQNTVTSTLHPVYLPVHQLGGTFQHVQEEWLWKGELAYRQFDGTTDSQFGDLDQVDHLQVALGLEYGQYHQSGSETNWLSEIQSYQGVSKTERSQIGLFQNDLLVGIRHAYNDIQNKEWFASLIIDLEREEELILGLKYSQRIGGIWTGSIGARALIAPKATKQATGLQQIENSDQLYINLLAHF